VHRCDVDTKKILNPEDEKKWGKNSNLTILTVTDANMVFNGVQHTNLCKNLRNFGLGFHERTIKKKKKKDFVNTC